MTSETGAVSRWPVWLVGFGSGSLFAAGLAISGMTDPGKVLGFLDFAGAWDATLAFVMAGAVALHFLWLRFSAAAEFVDTPASSEPPRRIDVRLVAGAALFGFGWGMSGYCPGPALVAAAYGRREAVLFVVAMVGGVALFRVFSRRRRAEWVPVGG